MNQGNFRILDAPHKYDFFIKWLSEQKELGATYTIQIKKGKGRTGLQNNAMHKYFEILAEALNDAGWDMKAVFDAKEVGVPWTKESVKLVLMGPIIKAMFDIESTAELSTVQLQQAYETLNKITSEKFGVGVPFPERMK